MHPKRSPELDTDEAEEIADKDTGDTTIPNSFTAVEDRNTNGRAWAAVRDAALENDETEPE